MSRSLPRFRGLSLLTTFFLLIIGLAAAAAPAFGQAPKIITLRMIDSRTGILISSDHYLIKVNHVKDEHGDWVKKAEDGSGTLTLPANATDISVHATYGYATDYYVNCDANKDHGSAQHAPKLDHWYSVDKILSDGIVAPNDCAGKKVPEKLQVIAKPGEFVFFVRELRTTEDFTQ